MELQNNKSSSIISIESIKRRTEGPQSEVREPPSSEARGKKIDPEAAETLSVAGLPLTKGNYFVLLFGDSEHEIDPEEYEILPPELRPAE